MCARSTVSTTTAMQTGYCDINPEECIDCGACEPACPVTAIFVDYDTPEQWSKFGEINALWYKDKDAARTQVDQYLASKEG